jgi:hypothetical protein
MRSQHKAPRPPRESRPKPNSAPADREAEIGSLTDERRREKHYKARLAELEFRRRAGELADIATMERDVFAVFRAARDELLNIPHRLAAVVAAESDQHRVHQLLAQEIRQVLNGLQRNIKFREEA